MSEVRSSPQPLLDRLQATLCAMPPVAAMGIRLDGYGDGRLRLHAPLAANVNDKGNAFGGSLASVMTLAGWALVTLRLQLAGFDAEVYVADSHIRYRAPVYDDLQASAGALEDADWETFLATFSRRGRARIGVGAWLGGEAGAAAAELDGRFVAIAKG
ncbi:YiiD C-terminal domain-containing protein [Flavobacterium sp. MXW15]|uniref:YiiD C-terminal domain-containing protein n=1 Tax=Xanthomonas chitinilytica TaxID=2989819 RepID=A0ABT3JZ26_9XANT|nr:YiiD C-terminal domain-containing protein [Xanthomonas sp. H13-6]MCW4456104.1 YiiD C-terminal domain-containing protein [Flavobacterium sp. MXW15]MCW4473701.1 YiiD C-terminal domain-containing protein [Xanthomonas sp. H13-6]